MLFFYLSHFYPITSMGLTNVEMGGFWLTIEGLGLWFLLIFSNFPSFPNFLSFFPSIFPFFPFFPPKWLMHGLACNSLLHHLFYSLCTDHFQMVLHPDWLLGGCHPWIFRSIDFLWDPGSSLLLLSLFLLLNIDNWVYSPMAVFLLLHYLPSLSLSTYIDIYPARTVISSPYHTAYPPLTTLLF